MLIKQIEIKMSKIKLEKNNVSVDGISIAQKNESEIQFYKCVSIDSPTEDQNIAIVKGAGSVALNGTYILDDSVVNPRDGKSAYVLRTNPPYYIIKYDGQWTICDNYDSWNTTPYYQQIGENWVDIAALSPRPTVEFKTIPGIDSKTWSGKKAILNNGIYEYQDNITQGLNYTLIKPIIGNTYTRDALVQSFLYTGIPNDYVFYASLNKHHQKAETGQSLATIGTVTYGKQQGVDCADFSQGCFMTSDSNLPTGSSQFTISLWSSEYNENPGKILGYGTPQSGQQIYIYFRGIDTNLFTVNCYNYGVSIGDGSSGTPYGIHSYVITVNTSNMVSLYIDGVFNSSGTVSYRNTKLGPGLYIGGCNERGNSVEYHRGKIAALRIYNRILSQYQICALANEFTPT